MSRVIKEIVIVSGVYTDKNNEEKKRWQKIGQMIETKKGPMLKIDAYPVSDPPWNGWCYLFDPIKEDAVPSSYRSNEKFDGDVPF